MKEKDMISTSDPRVCMIGHPAPAWLVNYADLMTELVCFFIVLYALSAALNKDVQQAKKDVEEKMKEQKVAAEVKVTKDGMQITLEEKGQNVFFASGSSDMTDKMEEVLTTIGPTLKKLADDGHEIIVEGHTDDIPIHTAKFTSNWDLSTARATHVVQSLIHEHGFPAKEMGAIGYGEYRPLVPNDTDEHRATNRRVVFFVKNKAADYSKKDKKEGGKAEGTVTAADSAEQAEKASPPSDGTSSDNSKEPTTDSALPLPQEAPVSQSSD